MAAYPPIAARVLYNRGVRSPEAAAEFLDASLPAGEGGSLLHEFRPAVERLARAVEQGERVAVYGDFDADGVTSSAILAKGLRGLGVTVMPYIPDRLVEGHGLNEGAVRLLAESGADLIVTADCGITDADEVALAAELGVDTIVTDHHSPPARLPDAAAVVNPKLPGQPEAYRDLASCGVAYKLMEALYEHGGRDLSESLLGLAALGTIADVAPLTAGNRALAREGLAALNRAEDAGIKALLDHRDHHNVFVGSGPVVASPQRSILPAALAALPEWRIVRVGYGGSNLLHAVHHRNDDAQRADVRRLLDVSLGGCRNTDERDGRRTAARPDHPRRVRVRQRAVLHLDPDEVETGVGHRAVDVGIGCRHGRADDLAAFGEFLFDRIE